MLRVTVRDRIAKDLTGRFQRTFGYIQGAAGCEEGIHITT
jgi:hypothetical protein